VARLTDAQLGDRRNHLGASDIAVLAGVSPYKTPFELYLEKIGELDPEARRTVGDKDRMERGHRLEDVALDWHAEINGIAIERIRRDVIHPRLPFIVVHPDARVKPWRQTRRLLEAKTSTRKWDVVPQHVEAQVQTQIAATGADVADVVVLGFDGPPTSFEVPRNDELILALEDLAATFWDRVERRDPPPLDGSRAASKYLDRLFREGPEEIADASQAEAVARLLAIRARIKELEHEDGEIVNALKFSMAGGTRLYAPKAGRVYWSAPADRRAVAWKEVAAALRAEVVRLRERFTDDNGFLMNAHDERLDAIESLYTTVAEGVRSFRVVPVKATTPEEIAS
jgi:putative phage-type endonuclease